jgi:hypothetical protein
MSYVDTARRLRPIIEDSSASLSDEEALNAPELFPVWNGNGIPYVVGARVQYNVKLYKCVQAHTSQADWTPDTAVSLWIEVPDPSQEWPEWKQPVGSHDAYQQGDKVSHNEKHWISDVDSNVWEPGVYGWTEA